jgi:general secretion pathway protein N
MTTRFLLLACCLLVCAVSAEIYAGTTRGEDDTEIVAATVPPRTSAKESQAMPAAVADRWVSVALGRPLFAPDRKPIAGAAAVDPGLPRLAGVIVSGGGAVAIFQPIGDSKPVTARTGDTVGGWEVTDISAERVGVRKSSEAAVLRPRFANLQGNAVASGPTTRPRWETAADSGVLRDRWSNPALQP